MSGWHVTLLNTSRWTVARECIITTTVVAESLSSTDQVDTTFGTQANNVVSQVLTDQVDLTVSTQVNDSVDAILHQSPNLIDQTEVIVGVEINQLDAAPDVTDIDANTPPALIDIDEKIAETVKHCRENGFSDNAVEIPRSLQRRLVVGRDLEITSPDQCPEGATNLIMIDRQNILRHSKKLLVWKISILHWKFNSMMR